MTKSILLPEEIDALLKRETPLGLSKASSLDEEITVSLEFVLDKNAPISVTHFLQLVVGDSMDMVKMVNEPMQIRINGQLVAQAEIKAMMICLTDILSKKERLKLIR